MRLPKLLLAAAVGFCISLPSLAALQDKYSLPEQYLKSEQAYLKEFPKLQDVMDIMIVETEKQLPKPQNDILHNRVCTALVYEMAKEEGMKPDDVFIAVAGDIMHNITKADKTAVLTDKEKLAKADAMVKKLKDKGFFKDSPKFWTDTSIYANPKLGNSQDHTHHITGAVVTGELLKDLGLTEEQMNKLQAAIVEHSTGYWYFRDAVSDTLGDKEGWALVFPAPEGTLSKFIHDADLISQFVYESVVPEGSKWRNLATKRWKAENTPEDQAFVVYYVFQRMYDEARTKQGKQLAKEQWDKIAPELKKLQGLKETDDPIKIKGVPEIFKR